MGIGYGGNLCGHSLKEIRTTLNKGVFEEGNEMMGYFAYMMYSKLNPSYPILF